jgi:hypothetical protein
MSETYEASIGEYSFIMNDDDRIEVWRNSDLSSPLVYLSVDAGSIDTEKKFHIEISHWVMTHG